MKETVEHNNRFYKQPNGEILTESEQLKEWLIVANKEIERLNNIINKLEKWLKEKDYNGFEKFYIEDALYKIEELKGSDKE